MRIVAGPPSRATAAWQPAGSRRDPGTRRFRFGLASAREQEPPLAEGALIGAQERYRIEAFLGQGGMGRVYAATRESDGRVVALKVLRQDRLAGDLAAEHFARFRQETAATARVGHPGIIEMHGFERTPDGEVLLSMELLQGESLEAWLGKSGRLSVGLNLLAGFADALDAAHRSGIVHRDIKPANLFIQHRDDGSIQPKILDFGLAKMAKTEHTQIETAAGTVLGTPYYLAPERALGRSLSPAADLYSLGVILYEMLTGHLPFDADNFMDILALHIRKEPLDPRQAVPDRVVPDGTARLCMVLLAKDPADRPRSAADVAARIRRLLQTEAEIIGAYATGPRVQANPDAATMHLHGVHERPTAAPFELASTEDAATIAPTEQAPRAVSDAMTVPVQTDSGDADPMGPMMAFASGERPARTRVETTYGKNVAVKRKAAVGASLWWLPIGAGVGVAGVVVWFFATRPPETAVPEPEPAPAAAVEPPTAAVGATEEAFEREPPRDPEPPAPTDARVEARVEPPAPEPTREPKRTPRTQRKRPSTQTTKSTESPPPPDPEPKPTKKVDNDPKSWRVDG